MFIKNISEDNLLWNEFLSGNEDAYNLIYRKYSKKLYLQGLQYTSDRELIKDCIHDVFVKIYRNRTNLKPLDSVKIYLFIALRNSIITIQNKQKIQFETLDGQPGCSEMSSGNNVEEDLINKEDETCNNALIVKFLYTLTTRQREVIHYRFYENMSIDDICILMEMNYQSVQNLIQRSLKKMKMFSEKNKKK